MKIGIITCGHVDPSLASYHGQYFDMIAASLYEVNNQLEFVDYDATRGELPSLDQCVGFIITGSVHNAYDNDPWIVELVSWIRRCEAIRRPLVGICFGHQIIARALGGTVMKSEKGWGLGSYTANVSVQKKWMNLSMDSVRMLVSHQDQVVTVPKGMKVIAGNDFCPNFMLAKDNHIFTVQGHPEFSSEFTGKLVEKRREIIGSAHAEDAFRQLNKPQDSALILHWIDSFLNMVEQPVRRSPSLHHIL